MPTRIMRCSQRVMGRAGDGGVSDYSRAARADANLSGSCTEAPPIGHIGGHRPYPSGRDRALGRRRGARARRGGTCRPGRRGRGRRRGGRWRRGPRSRAPRPGGSPTCTTRPEAAAHRRRGARARRGRRARSCRASRARGRPGRRPAIAATRVGHRGRVGRHDLDSADAAFDASPPRPGPRPRCSPTSRLEHDGLGGRREHPADGTDEPARLRRARSPGRRWSRTGRRARGCRARGRRARRRRSGARRRGPTRPSSSASATRHLRRSPGGSTPSSRREPADRAAVVGDADDRGDGARVRAAPRAARSARPCPPPSATTVGSRARPDASAHGRGPGGGRGTSKPRPLRTRASSSAMTTLRWRPPVQPTPIERYALPSRTNAGSSSANSRSSSSRKACASGWPSTYSRTGSSVPGSGRSSSIQCGFGRKRQSKRRSTSTGMPCLYPNDTMLVCSEPLVGAPSPNSSCSRSRSSCTLRFDVSTTRSAWPLSPPSSARSRVMPSMTRSEFGERVAAAGLLEPAHEHVVAGVEEHDARDDARARAARRARPRGRP